MIKEFESELYETAWTFCKGCGGPCRKGEDYCALPCAATFVDTCNDAGFLADLLTARLESITRSTNGDSRNKQLGCDSP
jgi:hypothetical protein